MFLSDRSSTNRWQHATFGVTMTRRYDVHMHRHVYIIYVYIYTVYTCTDLHAHVMYILSLYVYIYIYVCVFFILYIFGTSFVLYCGILERLSNGNHPMHISMKGYGVA